MNTDQMKSLIRAVLVALFGGGVGVWLVKRGITIDDNFITMAASLLAGAAGIVWSLFTHTKASTVATAASIVKIDATEQAKAGVTTPVKPTP